MRLGHLVAIPVMAFSIITLMPQPADAMRFNASRATVLAMCDRMGGGSFNDSQAYGCANENGWVFCESNGSCEGGRVARETRRTTQPRALPPARNRGN